MRKIMKNGIELWLDEKEKLIKAKCQNGLEIWLDENEELVKAKWEDGYEQVYNDNKITTYVPNGGLFKSKLNYTIV